MRNLLIKNGTTEEYIKIFNQMFSKRFKKITDEQARVLSKVCFLPTPPEKVKSEMLILAQQIKEFGREDDQW